MRCPICKQPVGATKDGERSSAPFCSDRCKLIDLGRWLDGKYQIPVRETDPDSAHAKLPREIDDDDDDPTFDRN